MFRSCDTLASLIRKPPTYFHIDMNSATLTKIENVPQCYSLQFVITLKTADAEKEDMYRHVGNTSNSFNNHTHSIMTLSLYLMFLSPSWFWFLLQAYLMLQGDWKSIQIENTSGKNVLIFSYSIPRHKRQQRYV